MTNRSSDLKDLLSRRTVRVGLAGNSKDEIVGALVEVLERFPEIRDLDKVREAVLDREAVMSTGVGKGLALPHAKTSAVSGTVAAFAVTEKPIEWGAIDNEPVRLVFMLVGTEAARSQHIRVLSRVSRLMNRDDFRTRLLDAHTADDVIEAFEEGDLALADN